MNPILIAENLTKHYRHPFTLRKIIALNDLNFTIGQGEVFGYLGPNGSGKTTTFKLLLSLIYPTRGRFYLWGKPSSSVAIKRRIGFLPESPYFYGYLKAGEYLRLCGQLFGIPRKELARRIESLFASVGLSERKNMMIKNFSKGMLQRLGLAQSLINDPELLILDEPMSGLDPLGRREVRNIILALKKRGKTILFSTHILSDVEMICDQVGIIMNGSLRDCGPLKKLLNPTIKSVEIHLTGVSEEKLGRIRGEGNKVSEKGEERIIQVPEEEVPAILSLLVQEGGRLISLNPLRKTLEDIYVSEANSAEKRQNT